MNATAMDISGQARRVITAQLVAATVLGLVMFLAFGLSHGLSAVFGCLVGLALTLLLSRSVRRAAEVAQTDPKRGMTMLYVGAVQRFVFVIAAFALGYAVFGLNPLAGFVGFAAAQLAQLVNMRGTTRTNENEGRK